MNPYTTNVRSYFQILIDFEIQEKIDVMSKKLPNFFIVGAAKAGTTSLHRYLEVHPQIYMSSIKEPHHFSSDFNPVNFRKSYSVSTTFVLDEYLSGSMKEVKYIAHLLQRSDYLSVFRNVKNEKAIGESSTGYLYSKVAARAIWDAIPDAKIIMILRNPIHRAFSHFLMDYRSGNVPATSFREAVKIDFESQIKGWGISSLYVDLGLYYEQVKRYLDIFPKENVKILFFDDFISDPHGICAELFEFLEVDHIDIPDQLVIHNSSQVHKFPLLNLLMARSGAKNWIVKSLPTGFTNYLREKLILDGNVPQLTQVDVDFMVDYFRDDISKLSSLLDKDLSYWFVPLHRQGSLS